MEETLKDALRAFIDPSDPVPTTTFVIEVTSGPEQGARLVTSADRLLVGTSPACHLILTDKRVSRRHLVVTVEGDTLRVEDLASTNGTFTNELRITGAYLKGGETISIGTTRLLVTATPRTGVVKSPAPTVSFGRVLGTSAPM